MQYVLQTSAEVITIALPFARFARAAWPQYLHVANHKNGRWLGPMPSKGTSLAPLTTNVAIQCVTHCLRPWRLPVLVLARSSRCLFSGARHFPLATWPVVCTPVLPPCFAHGADLRGQAFNPAWSEIAAQCLCVARLWWSCLSLYVRYATSSFSGRPICFTQRPHKAFFLRDDAEIPVLNLICGFNFRNAPWSWLDIVSRGAPRPGDTCMARGQAGFPAPKPVPDGCMRGRGQLGRRGPGAERWGFLAHLAWLWGRGRWLDILALDLLGLCALLPPFHVCAVTIPLREAGPAPELGTRSCPRLAGVATW